MQHRKLSVARSVTKKKETKVLPRTGKLSTFFCIPIESHSLAHRLATVCRQEAMLTVFLICNILLPYTIYTLCAIHLKWQDRRKKSPVRHANEITSVVLLGTAIYFVGGYGATFHLMSPAINIFTITTYGVLSEYAAFQTSLVHVRAWRWQMWTATSLAGCITLGFVAAHTLYAITVYGMIVALAGYLATFLLLPIFITLLVYGLAQTERQRQNADMDDFELEVGEERGAILQDSESLTDDSEDEQDHGDGDNGDDEEDDVDALRTLPPRPMRSSTTTTTPRLPIKSRRRRRKVSVHLHHYQIFAFLAFFTRFPTPWSRVAAGLTLGCMMHGVAAYGVDSIFEYDEDD